MKKGSKSLFGRIVTWVHLWPSLISAVLLVFVCLTGTIIVYCDEIIDFANRDVLYVEEVKDHKLPLDQLLAKFREAYPKRRSPGYMVTYRDPARTVKFNSFDPGQGLRFVFMDPYTGKILKEDPTIHFFYVTAHLHSQLLLHEPGFWVVAVCTIIFLIELITGLILWWPTRWTAKSREQSFKIKWSAKIKRVNYDLHNVLGFYAFSISFILTVTGLIIAFKPLSSATIATFGGDPTHHWEEVLPAFEPSRPTYDLFKVTDRYFSEVAWAEAAQVNTYTLDSSGHYAIKFARRIGLKSSDGAYPVFVDRYTGQQAGVSRAGILHEKVENTYWALHMGTWMGWFGKLMTFIGGLIATSLPITGFFIWWNRRRKPKRSPAPARKTVDVV